MTSHHIALHASAALSCATARSIAIVSEWRLPGVALRQRQLSGNTEPEPEFELPLPSDLEAASWLTETILGDTLRNDFRHPMLAAFAPHMP